MNNAPLFTIGYGSRPIAEFIALLRQYGIQRLVDARSVPTSRFRPDYRKAALTAHLAQAGIEYVFMGDALGGRPSDPAYTTDGQVDYAKLKQQPFYLWGIEVLKTAWEQGVVLAVMCAEQKPQRCHRALLIGMTLAEKGLPVRHIDENGVLLTQEKVLEQQNRQLSMF